MGMHEEWTSTDCHKKFGNGSHHRYRKEDDHNEHEIGGIMILESR